MRQLEELRNLNSWHVNWLWHNTYLGSSSACISYIIWYICMFIYYSIVAVVVAWVQFQRVASPAFVSQPENKNVCCLFLLFFILLLPLFVCRVVGLVVVIVVIWVCENRFNITRCRFCLRHRQRCQHRRCSCVCECVCVVDKLQKSIQVFTWKIIRKYELSFNFSKL